MKLRFDARIAFFATLLGAALPGATLLPACSVSQCAAACVSRMTLTVTNADVTAHTYVITMTAPELGTLTETCASTTDAGTTTCTGGFLQDSAASGQIRLEIDATPVPVDVTVTKDGAQVASAHLTPTGGTVTVCGEVCQTGDVTVALP
jgi:hypothetical protein